MPCLSVSSDVLPKSDSACLLFLDGSGRGGRAVWPPPLGGGGGSVRVYASLIRFLWSTRVFFRVHNSMNTLVMSRHVLCLCLAFLLFFRSSFSVCPLPPPGLMPDSSNTLRTFVSNIEAHFMAKKQASVRRTVTQYFFVSFFLWRFFLSCSLL